MKNILIVFTLFVSTFAITSCREKETKTVEVVREVEVKTEDKDGILERAAKEVDKEVNQEVDKAIDKIGNDD